VESLYTERFYINSKKEFRVIFEGKKWHHGWEHFRGGHPFLFKNNRTKNEDLLRVYQKTKKKKREITDRPDRGRGKTSKPRGMT